ncbi:hypothetical protein EYF80_048175 [Liparis tanakae]|uniref:Uncharacterized protein n=1 Tax=Liparis tanakae TaxID=230148 RepID=A0A4Z2FL77_9TELE|nr:hypothetical protein EYF80_048175 [Liparis tanakae]
MGNKDTKNKETHNTITGSPGASGSLKAAESLPHREAQFSEAAACQYMVQGCLKPGASVGDGLKKILLLNRQSGLFAGRSAADRQRQADELISAAR